MDIRKKSRYIDISYDIGFKLIFEDPDHPELLIGLLNALIPGARIHRIEFLPNEVNPESIEGKRVRMDLRCYEPDGGQFVVEMQKDPYDYFPDRVMAYSGDPLKRSLKAGENYSDIRPVYMVCILNYILNTKGDTDSDRGSLLRSAHMRMDDSKEILSDSLNLLFLQLPVAKELSHDQDFLAKFAWSVKNIATQDSMPEALRGNEYFEKMYALADREYISEEKLNTYDYMVRDEIQIKAERDYAVREGRAEGRAEGLQEGMMKEKTANAVNLLALGVPVSTVAKALGMTEEQVKDILHSRS